MELAWAKLKDEYAALDKMWNDRLQEEQTKWSGQLEESSKEHQEHVSRLEEQLSITDAECKRMQMQVETLQADVVRLEKELSETASKLEDSLDEKQELRVFPADENKDPSNTRRNNWSFKTLTFPLMQRICLRRSCDSVWTPRQQRTRCRRPSALPTKTRSSWKWI